MAQGSPIYIDSDFLKLWVGESISVFGSQFSPIAIQYAAKVMLDAQPIQFGILSALGSLSFLLFGIPVGLYADSHRRKITMIYADVGRALILLSIPITATLGFLSMNLFYLVAFATGVLTVFFEICYQSYIPSLVERSKLVVANSRIQTSAATASASGPTVATTLIQIVSAPMVVFGDVIGYFSSAAFLGSISKPEPPIARRRDRSAWSDAKEGLSVVFRDSRLSSIAGCTAMSNLFTTAYWAVLIPYLLGLGVPIVIQGPIFSIGAIGGIIGAVVSLRLFEPPRDRAVHSRLRLPLQRLPAPDLLRDEGHRPPAPRAGLLRHQLRKRGVQREPGQLQAVSGLDGAAGADERHHEDPGLGDHPHRRPSRGSPQPDAGLPHRDRHRSRRGVPRVSLGRLLARLEDKGDADAARQRLLRLTPADSVRARSLTVRCSRGGSARRVGASNPGQAGRDPGRAMAKLARVS